jgi:uncharacterized membrane protein YcaP (DUF421 family)
MIETTWQYITSLLGLDIEPRELTFVHVSARGVLVFISALIMARIGDKRFIAKNTAFDFILAIIIASVLARAINGSGPLFATIGTCFVLVLLHRLFAFGALKLSWFGALIKGNADRLIENGKVIHKNLKKNHVSMGDLMEAVRLRSSARELDEVQEAWIERSGDISVILRK